MDNPNLNIQSGLSVRNSDPRFSEALVGSVDYRGDVTLILADGNSVEGYIFSIDSQTLDLFPKNSPRAVSIPIKEVDTLVFSGENTASGKSWEDWVTKKETEKSAIKAQPIEMA